MSVIARIAGWTALVVAFAMLLWAAKEFVPPKVESANTYSTKDPHPNERVTAAVDDYSTSPKADIFGTRYSEEGILPVLLIITNDGDQPVSMKNMRAQLVTTGKTKLEALHADDVFRRVAHISGKSTNPRPIGPITLPGHGPTNKKAQQQYDEIMRARFQAQAVEPHATKSGFLFFDIEGVKQPVAGSRVYLTDMRDNNGTELMYFEIPLLAANAATPVQ